MDRYRTHLARSVALLGWALVTALFVGSKWHFHFTLGGAALRDEILGGIAVMGTCLLMAMPGFLLAVLLRKRWADWLFVGWLLVSSFFFLADAVVYGSFGRHLSTILSYAHAERNWEVAGGGAQWARAAFTELGVAGVCVAAGILLGLGAARIPSLSRRQDRWNLVLATGAVAVPGILTTVSAPLWANEADFESTFETLAMDVRLVKHPDADFGQRSVLESQLSNRLVSARERLGRDAADGCVLSGKLGGRPSGVVVMVVESLRPDVVTEELMPRLTRYARRGLRLDGHFAGSILSEAGMFALLFAKSPLTYDLTLDAHAAPCATRAFSQLGYETAYFSGQPERWRRAEEFVNSRTFGRYHHDDRGTWPEWDVRALQGVTELARASERPVFSVAYLMSSHFEYQFPMAYEVDRPAESGAHWPDTDMRGLGAADAPLFRNRYRNTIRFLDDAIMDAVERLDPLRNIVVVTGDHGESLYDDGHYGHGYSFADVIARTPAIVVGPGIIPARREDPTLHADLLPTLVHAATGGSVVLSRVHGRDLQAPAAPRSGWLLAAPDGGRRLAVAQLRSGDMRIDLQLRFDEGKVYWDGIRDPLGKRQNDQHLSADLRRKIGAAFDEALREMAPD
jgi:hypothetical protein